VDYRKRWVLLEVKVDGGRITKQQAEFIAETSAPVHIVRDPQEAVEIVIEECR
jgi:phenylpyruvate tautomerase PptA (4-oxalocrotonate tautomerase family)